MGIDGTGTWHDREVGIRLVIFDIAGTTVKDPDGVGSCLKAALTADGVPWEADEVNAIMGIPKPMAIASLLRTAGLPTDAERIDAIHQDFRARMIEYYRTDPSVEEIEGATQVFAELRNRGIRVALDTGFDRPIVDALLQRLGWDSSVVDVTVTSDEVAHGRPHPDLVFRAMELAEVTDVSEVAKVGDTPSDLNEGTAAGCAMVIGVTEGTHSFDQLVVHPHTHLVPNINGVPSLVA